MRDRKFEGSGIRGFLLALATGAVLVLGLPAAATPSHAWVWAAGVPGRSVAADALIREAGTNGPPVALSDVRELAAVGSGPQRQSLVAAPLRDGTVCLAFRSRVVAGRFSCLGAATEERPVIYSLAGGGHRASSLDWIAVVGVTRDDGARVTLDLAGGETTELKLNEWRAFAYVAHSDDAFPRTIAVYAHDGSLLARSDLQAAPLAPS